MPRFPDAAPTIAGLGGRVFSGLARRIRRQGGDLFPFHIGDTWMEPAPGSRMEDLRTVEHPGMHRYAPVRGLPELLEVLPERVQQRHGVPTTRSNLLVTAGATGGLGAAVGAITEPGDEVLIAAPHWPLIAGIVTSFRSRPTPVPIFGYCESAGEAIAALDSASTEKTVAVYWNTPNNPTGRALPADWLSQMVAWAARRNLWILADEVYEDLGYTEAQTFTRSLAPERTFSVHSFSKAYGMAGNRCGYVVAPEQMITQLQKVSTHTFYSAPTASQIAACRVLSETGDRWLDQARRAYSEVGRAAAERLSVPTPEGSTFLFLDVAEQLTESGLPGFLERCADNGILVAPGPSFGPFETHIRICFTATPPERTMQGIEILAGILGR